MCQKKRMNHNNDILQELQALAPALIPLHGKQVFSVPAGYFDRFSGDVTAILHGESSNILTIPHANMTVPQGFFEGFASSVLQKIKATEQLTAAEEIKLLSPALSATGNDNVFTVPGSYFKNFPDILLSQVSQPAKVISMKSRSSFARYAAAAVITGILGLSTFSIFNSRNEAEEVNVTALAMADAKNIIQTNSFDRVMETVSDQEIVGFLQQGGQDVEAALVASSIDSKELPSAEEYILNENTLDNYLETLDITYPN